MSCLDSAGAKDTLHLYQLDESDQFIIWDFFFIPEVQFGFFDVTIEEIKHGKNMSLNSSVLKCLVMTSQYVILRIVKSNIGGGTPYSTGHHVKSTHAVDDTYVYVCVE